MNGGESVSLLSFNEKINYQAALDEMRIDEKFDFAGLALHKHNNYLSPIKWCYVSNNINDRYKLIVLRTGKGIAGNVMKTGKRIVIEDINQFLLPSEKHKYPIVLCELLTAVVAIPLWYRKYVYGVLLLGQRNNKPLPETCHSISITSKFGIFNEED
ncbi:MAG TPA: nitrate respiration regulation accessory nitrate sensor NreA [Staphylococcus sp.]|nr:nitrate respiration regulation accessory nitrate sensor NreA [Staphylococcus sp.]